VAVLRLASCELGVEGTGVLCEALKESQNIVQVELRNNDLGDAGAEVVAAYIAKVSCLRAPTSQSFVTGDLSRAH
jgi:hypothetical protein